MKWLELLLAAPLAFGAPRAFDWFAVSESVKIFEDGFGCPAPRGAIDVFGVRGEYISAQGVLVTRAPLEDVTVETGRFLHEDGSASLPASATAWNFVGSVPVPKNSPYAQRSRYARLAPARFPDPLLDVRRISLPAGRYQPVWFTLHVPENAAAGRYNGEVIVRTSAGSASLPFHVTVYPLRMPERRHLNVTTWYSTRGFARFHGIKEAYSEPFWAMLKKYAGAIAEHRQNVFRVNLNTIGIAQEESGKLAFDFSRFDRWADTFWNTGHMDLLETGFVAERGVVNGQRFYSREISFAPCEARRAGKPVKVHGGECMPQLLGALERHLREKGWLEKTLFHICDEPTNWNVLPWRECSRKVHQWAPGLRRVDAIEGTGFGNDLEVWVPKLNHLSTWLDTFKSAQARGAELWYYLAMPLGAYPNRYIDYPLIETRILHWLNYRYGITGFLHWGFNAWTDDPFHIMNRENVGAGDAWLAYPAQDGLLSSIRWEMMRSGLQDYEYLWLLQDKAARLKRRLGPAFDWIEPSRRGVELSARVIADFGHFTEVPEVLHETRLAILREILDFDREPLLYVQTIPADGAKIVYGPARIEVRGWTGPGTEITVNNAAVPVSPEGYFADAPPYMPHDNVVTVKAKNAKGEKIVTRTFYSVP